MFSRFLQLQKLLTETRREEVKEKFVLAAYVGWQLGAAGKKTFGEHLQHLGLSDEAPQSARSQKEEDGVLSRMGIKAKEVGF